jgi:hypothetical protein
VQHPASLYLPHPRHQKHRLVPKSFHRVLMRTPVKSPPPTRCLTIPTSGSRLRYTAPKLARMLVLSQASTHPLVPRQAISTGGRDSTQQDVPRQDLQVAKQLLALIARPHMAVLRTAPTAAHAPAPVQPTTTTTAATDDRVNSV